MASYNKAIFLGRLTRDPESRSFNNGGKVTKFGLAFDAERKKDQSTGKWESVPAFIDCEAFNRGEYGKLADTVETYCTKGSQVLVECHVKQENWTSQDGQKRSKLVFVVDSLQLMGSKKDNEQPSAFQRKADESQRGSSVEPTFAPDESVDRESIPF